MKNRPIDNRDIFEQVGNLFYAIAVDQHIQPLEVGELKSLISKDWLPRNLTKSLVSDETHFILVTMDSLQGNKVTANEAFSDFSKFYMLHPEVFSKEVRKRLLDTSVKIAKVFKADNPFNNPHLMELRDILNFERVKA
jgi:hypothetical protein